MDSENKNQLLIVDDDDSVCFSLKEILGNRFNILTASSARNALEILKQNSNGSVCIIDLVISDICMSHMDGLELLKEIKKGNSRVEVIMMTGYPSPENTLNALRFGASDYLVKPFQTMDVLESISRVMEKRKENVRIEKIVNDLKIAVRKNYSGTTEALMQAIDAKDNYTKEHCARVAKLMVEFAKKLNLGEDQEELLYKVSLLHDIGKIGINEEILNKKGRLTAEEYDMIKNHPVVGFKILQPIEFLETGRSILLHHHERIDGKGYPNGLKGEEIPLGARMLAIIDTYDAMITDRPYRKGMRLEEAITEIEKCSGTQFDPKLAVVFIDLVKVRNKAKE